MGDLLVLLVIVGVLFMASWKLYRDKKNGIKCSGCAYGKTCGTTVCSEDKSYKKSTIPVLKK